MKSTSSATSDCEETKEEIKCTKFIEVDEMVSSPQPSEEVIQCFAKRRISGYFTRVEPVRVKKVQIKEIRSNRASTTFEKVDS